MNDFLQILGTWRNLGIKLFNHSPISKYLPEIFSPIYIKLIFNNHNKDFKSVKRRRKSKKLELERKMFSS